MSGPYAIVFVGGTEDKLMATSNSAPKTLTNGPGYTNYVKFVTIHEMDRDVVMYVPADQKELHNTFSIATHMATQWSNKL